MLIHESKYGRGSAIALVRAWKTRHVVSQKAANGRMILNISLGAVAAAILLTTLTGVSAATTEVPAWILVAAILALALGIPHGAVDHLTLTKRLAVNQLIGLGLVYLLIAAAAVIVILLAPGIAFIVVIAMTVWHFGSGDVEAMQEIDGTPPERGFTWYLHAIAVGSAPVILPLTSPAAVSTLNAIQPKLADLFTVNVIVVVRVIVLILIIGALLVLIHQERVRATVELALLAALGFFVAPLFAFAIYFTFWHALRHTARLAQHKYGDVGPASIIRTFAQGLPSLIGFIVIVSAFAIFTSPETWSGAWLWFGLAIVWGLTVPHMLAVSAFDRRQRLTELGGQGAIPRS
jgi:beta-carotene 15,15'-dioxygenase